MLIVFNKIVSHFTFQKPKKINKNSNYLSANYLCVCVIFAAVFVSVEQFNISIIYNIQIHLVFFLYTVCYLNFDLCVFYKRLQIVLFFYCYFFLFTALETVQN